ncbi:MAG: deoxyhypusine synthase family protein [Candidatus Diapherotrites archaeon]|nr:deoxyhypusine synthase family protein [Candidatus Diapherotrites archaeon]
METRKKEYLQEKLEAIDPSKERKVSDLLGAMSNTGFQGKQLGLAANVFEKMIRDPDTTILLGYAGSMSTTGQWKIIRWLIENHYIDGLVSTGANISEDILDAMGYGYYKGSHVVDDYELLQCQIDRFYDVYADEKEYRKMEGTLLDFMKTLPTDKAYSSAEYLHLLGKYLDEKNINSITATAYREKIPIFSPAMADSGYGVAACELQKTTGKIPIVNQFKDFVQLGEIGEKAKTTSVFYIGGGVPKDTIQLVAVIVDLSRGGDIVYPHKYAIQVTTDSPQWGSLSGCTFEEAISWGKIDKEGERAFCHCDATIALPMIAQTISERVKEKRTGRDLSFVFNDLKEVEKIGQQAKPEKMAATPLKI